MLDAFRTATGNHWTPGRTPLDQQIDAACGADVAFLQAFAAWMTREVWGEE